MPEPLAGEKPRRVLAASRVPVAPAHNPATEASPSGFCGVEIQALLTRETLLLSRAISLQHRLFYENVAAEAGDGQAALRPGDIL